LRLVPRTPLAVLLAIAPALFLAPALLFAQAPPKRYEIEIMPDLVYGKGGGMDLQLDCARPKEPGPFPGVLCIHGGGWSGGKRQDFRFLIERLAAHGYVAVSASYRLAPAHLFPAQIEDVKCAVRWMRAHSQRLQLDPSRIGATGGSAGGHLACLLGASDAGDRLEGSGGWECESSRVQAVVNLFGPTDLTTGRWSEAADKILQTFIGGTLDARREDYRRASPVSYLSRGDPPVLTFHGTADPLVPFEQAEILHRRLKELGIENHMVAFEGRGHGWLGADLELTVEELIAFFDRHLKGRRIDRV
jgi:acetyl esterase/lipase